TFAASNDTTDAPAGPGSRVINLVAETIKITDRPSSSDAPLLAGAERSSAAAAEGNAGPRFPEALGDLVGRASRARSATPGPAARPRASHRDILPEGAQFVSGSYSDRAGSRAYKLYIPRGYRQGQ